MHTGAVPEIEELFPGYIQLYNWVMTEEYDIRGNPEMMGGVLVMLVVLILDIVFPNLFFLLSHGLAVENAEPSDFHRFGQMFGRIICVIMIVVLIVAGFAVHY